MTGKSSAISPLAHLLPSLESQRSRQSVNLNDSCRGATAPRNLQLPKAGEGSINAQSESLLGIHALERVKAAA